jgi:hypothetical protein
MTRSLEEADDLSSLDAQVLREIHTDGWQISGVLSRRQKLGPSFAYSIGFFHTMVHPEVILFGLPVQACMKTVNAIGLEIQSGRQFQADRIYESLVKPLYLCCFKEVDPRCYREHVNYALWFYESDPFPMLQCFWSDHYGRFPWDPDCSPYARESQPVHLLAEPCTLPTITPIAKPRRPR